ncbi:hypothetical protein JR065_04695 [Xanthomonas sp. AmX2]|uniref:hypothetical protein n=1 Tax=Xanthomonas sp. TaxID=29446 RepID=UPI00197EC94C|nr:hypothetical protein [Xanthomonas sp.]MBN6149629.1 hypothetical protein [Xanthomonas sp.]
MDTAARHRVLRGIGAAAWLALFPALALASGARQGVKAQPGEIVVLRDVSARPAYRPAPPGMALIADPSPERELQQTLGGGLDELSDGDYAAMDATAAAPGHAGGASRVERIAGGAIEGTLGRASGAGGSLSGAALSQGIGVPMGAVGSATRGIGDQVRGALAQFPLAQPAAGAGR